MSGGEKLTGACASCMEPVSAVAVPVLCASSASGRAAPPRSRARSACCSILWSPALSPSDGVTGVVALTAGPASSWCALNASRSRSHLPPRPFSRVRLRPFPVGSGRIIACRGKNDWLAMLAFPPLGKSPSGCLASQKPLRPRSGWNWLDLRCRSRPSLLSSRTALLLRMEPRALFFWLLLASSQLLPPFLSILLVLPALTRKASRSARLALSQSRISSSIISLRTSWANGASRS